MRATELVVVFGNQNLTASTGIPVVKEYVGADPYDGPYEVTPAVFEQSLNTAHKMMDSDVTVHEIPYNAVSNPAGGKTYTIGGI